MDINKLNEIRSGLEQELDILEILVTQPQSLRLLNARFARIENIKAELERLKS